MNHTAYLVGYIDTRLSPPGVVSISIHSAPAIGLTHDFSYQLFDIVQMEGTSFGNARVKLLAYLSDCFEKYKPYKWIEPFLKQEMEEYNK